MLNSWGMTVPAVFGTAALCYCGSASERSIFNRFRQRIHIPCVRFTIIYPPGPGRDPFPAKALRKAHESLRDINESPQYDENKVKGLADSAAKADSQLSRHRGAGYEMNSILNKSHTPDRYTRTLCLQRLAPRKECCNASFTFCNARRIAMHNLERDRLPHVTSGVDHFLVNPHGDTDGLVLTNGLEVHFPPHFSAEVLAVVRAGDRVTIYGVVPRATTTLTAVAIETEDGQHIAA
jgi:hypothetical protein